MFFSVFVRLFFGWGWDSSGTAAACCSSACVMKSQPSPLMPVSEKMWSKQAFIKKKHPSNSNLLLHFPKKLSFFSLIRCDMIDSVWNPLVDPKDFGGLYDPSFLGTCMSFGYFMICGPRGLNKSKALCLVWNYSWIMFDRFKFICSICLNSILNLWRRNFWTCKSRMIFCCVSCRGRWVSRLLATSDRAFLFLAPRRQSPNLST